MPVLKKQTVNFLVLAQGKAVHNAAGYCKKIQEWAIPSIDTKTVTQRVGWIFMLLKNLYK